MSRQRLISNLNALRFNKSAYANASVVVDDKLFTVRGVNNNKAFESVCLFLFNRIDANRTESELKGHLKVFSSADKKRFVHKIYKWLIEIRARSNLFDRIPVRRSELLSYRGKNLVKNMEALTKYVLQKEDEERSIKSEDINTPEYRPACSYTAHNSYSRASDSSSSPAPPPGEVSISLPSLREYILGDFFTPEMKPLNSYLPLADDEVETKPLLLTQAWSPPQHLLESFPPSPSPFLPPSPLPPPSRKRGYEEEEEVVSTPLTSKRRLWFS